MYTSTRTRWPSPRRFGVSQWVSRVGTTLSLYTSEFGVIAGGLYYFDKKEKSVFTGWATCC